jgi:hypothetical protein
VLVGGRERAVAVMPDIEEMKAKVREAIIRPAVTEKDMYWSHGVCQRIARSRVFELFINAVIAVHVVWFALDAEFNDELVPTQAPLVFQVGEQLFCLIYFFEWAVRFGALQLKADGFKDNWFIFDTVLAVLVVSDTWVMYVIFQLANVSNDQGFQNASLFRVFRMARLIKMTRILKLLRWMPELMIFLHGIQVATRSVCVTLLLLGIIMYIYAIIFMNLTKGTPLRNPKFSNLSQSIMTLLLEGVIPDQKGIVDYMMATLPAPSL